MNKEVPLYGNYYLFIISLKNIEKNKKTFLRKSKKDIFKMSKIEILEKVFTTIFKKVVLLDNALNTKIIIFICYHIFFVFFCKKSDGIFSCTQKKCQKMPRL